MVSGLAFIVDLRVSRRAEADAFLRKTIANLHMNWTTCSQLFIIPDLHSMHTDIRASFDDEKIGDNYFVMEGKGDIVEKVYKIKQEIDSQSLETIVLMCPRTRNSEWTSIRKEMFSPMYQFIKNVLDFPSDASMETLIPADEEASIIAQRIRSSFADFLRFLPSDGVLAPLYSSIIPSKNFIHGFSTRCGGISTYPGIRSLNVHYTSKKRDSLAVINENWRRLAEHVRGFDHTRRETIVAVHGTNVWVVGQPKPNNYDGLVTDIPGLTVIAPGADCIPIMFADPVRKCCGAAHAGWRGTIYNGGIAMAMVKIMIENFKSDPKDIYVALGPAIGPCCFRLTKQDATLYENVDPACVKWNFEKTIAYVDLHKTNRLLLEKGGIPSENIDDQVATECTCCTPERYYSNQRDGFPFGNQVAFISIKDEPKIYI